MANPIDASYDLTNPKLGLAQDCSQCATVNLPVIRNYGLREWIVTAHNDVTPVLAPN